MLMGWSKVPGAPVSASLGVGLGLIALLAMVGVAVPMFMVCSRREEEFEFLQLQRIDTEYGVSGMVGQRKADFRDTHLKLEIRGTFLCILSAVPVTCFSLLGADSPALVMTGVCWPLALAVFGMFLRRQ